MDLTKANLRPYINYDITDIMTLKGKLGFRVTLIYSDGSTKICQHSGFLKNAAAKSARNEVIAQLQSNTYVVYPNVKVKELLPYWLIYVMCADPSFKASSYKTYKNCIDKHIVPKLGNLKLLQLNQGHLSKLYKELAANYSSIPKLAKTILNTSIQFALSKRLILINPCEGVDLPKSVPRNEYHTVTIKEGETFTLEQVKTLLLAARKSRVHIQVVLAVLMGLRKSEINGLKYSDVDFTRKKLRIRHQLGESISMDEDEMEPVLQTKQEITVKTPSSERELDIPDYVLYVLLEERKRYEKNRSRRQHGRWTFQDLDYICCSSYGRPRSKDYHFPHYKRLLEDAGLPHIRFHDLRKTYTTLLMKNDVNQKALATALGHAKSLITIDTYTDTQAIIEDCTDVIEPFILEVHPFDKEDKQMLWEMFGIAITLPDETNESVTEASEDSANAALPRETLVNDFTDIEEMYDIAEWYLGEEEG